MIKNIIKRDGRVEGFTPGKVNKWGEWASMTLGEQVDWSSVVMHTVSTLPETVSSQVLQERLIKTCLDYNSWAYNRMAGRLYAAYLYKTVFDGTLPTVKQLHDKLVGLGIMRSLDYSEEEYREVEKLIKHRKDLKASYFELHQIREKYSLKNRLTNEEYETQQFVYMRMAMALAEDQPRDRRMADLKAWYEHFSEKRINAPTPNYVNLGTNLRGYASCCVYTTEDDVKSLSIGDHISYIMTCMSAGIGAHINTRSLGDPVRGGIIKHQGRLPYYRSLVGAVKANLQNGRGGAATAYYTAFDPEVDVIARLKNPMSTEDKKIRGLDYAITVNKFFAKKAAKNEDIFTFNSYTAPELWKAFYSDNETFESLYLQYEQDESFEKNYVSAREILITALNEAYETGRHYLIWIDEVNRHTPFKETIYSSNLCVAPETLLLTDQGHVAIASVAGQEVNVWNGEQFSKTQVVKTGENQSLWNVQLSDGRALDCTPYHKWYVMDGYGQAPREVRTHELKPGDKLVKLTTPVIEGDLELDRPYMNGFFTADGTQLPNGQAKLYLYGDKVGLHDRFEDNIIWRDNGDLRLEAEVWGLREKYFVPDARYSVQSRLAWLAGWLDGDGTVYRNGDNEALVGTSTDLGFLKRVQYLLQTLGVQAKVTLGKEAGFQLLPMNDGSGNYGKFYCQTTYRLLISSYGTYHLMQLGLPLQRLSVDTRQPQRNAAQFAVVVSVTDQGRVDDTYCVTEPLKNMAVFNGILTGQCLEIALATSGYTDMLDLYSEEDHGRGEIGLCSLAGIVLPNIKSDAEYEDAMYYALLMIDKCIHQAEYPLPHLGVTAKARMNAGVGVIGLAHYMARKKLSYATTEGKQELHRIAERHMYLAIRQSLRLGQELGNAPWMHKSKWPEGWLPIDTYNPNVDSIAAFSYQYDWEKLREEVVANGGIRNTVLVAHMPSESSSKGSGTTNGLYPVRALTLLKTDNQTVVDWAAPEGDRLAEHYDIAWDLDSEDLIDTYAIFQKFTDQAISGDLYRKLVGDEYVTSTEMLKLFFYMTKMGLKTRYYQITLTSQGSNLKETDAQDLFVAEDDDEDRCAGGSCTL